MKEVYEYWDFLFVKPVIIFFFVGILSFVVERTNECNECNEVTQNKKSVWKKIKSRNERMNESNQRPQTNKHTFSLKKEKYESIYCSRCKNKKSTAAAKIGIGLYYSEIISIYI